MKKELILIGGGGHCHSCIDVIEMENKFKIKGILDIPINVGKVVLGHKIIGTDDEIQKYTFDNNISFLITIGQIQSPESRINIFNKLIDLGANLATIISPIAHVSKNAKLGRGVIVMHQALVNSNATVGDNVILNTKCLIEHDTEIGEHSHIATAAIVNGNVKIGKGVFLGSNCVVKQGVKIPDRTLLQAGSFFK
jgi:sugar O-acyltransferase (sialic acid O-acetyltransferase NeuD family)